MNASAFFIRLLSLLSLILVSLAAMNFYIDPLLQYRDHRDALLYLNGSQRLLHPGALKYRPYETLLLGSSMVQYMRPSMVESVYGGKAFNASLAGSSAYEQAVTFDTANQHHKAQRILWSIDLFAFSGATQRGANNLPDYLYDDRHYDDIRYLLNPDTIKRSIKTLQGPRRIAPLDPNFDWDWLSARERRYGLAVVRQAVQHKRFLYNFDRRQYTAEQLQANFTRHFLSRIQRNPELRFEIFFPPYSLLTWAHLRDIGWLDNALQFKQFMIAQLLAQPNVVLHDFQTQQAITADLQNYLDETHFSPVISLQLLQAMKAGSARLTPATVPTQLAELKRQALNANVQQLLRSE